MFCVIGRKGLIRALVFAGVYYISDKQMDYCNTFDAHLKVTAT